MPRVVTYYARPQLYRDRLLMLSHVGELIGPVEVLFGGRLEDKAVRAREGRSFRVTRLGGVGLMRHVAVQRAVFDRFKRGRVDLLHGTQGFMSLLFADPRVRARGVVCLGGTFASHYDWLRTVRWIWPYADAAYARHHHRMALHERLDAHLAHGYTVFGEGHRAPLAEAYGLSVERIHAVPNCVDESWFDPRTPAATLPVSSGDFVVGFVGRWIRHKGTSELLQAIARLAPRHPRLKLVVVGEVAAADRPALHAALGRFGLEERVHLLGPRPRAELPALYRAFHVLALPSFLEGSPRAVLEAMAMACPVVATDLPGIRALDPCGHFLTLVERGSVVSLVDGLEAMLDTTGEERAATGSCGRAHLEAHHTPRAAARLWAELYTSLLGS